jgi:hypothetical protein
MTCLLTSQALSAQVKFLALPDVLQVFGGKKANTPSIVWIVEK